MNIQKSKKQKIADDPTLPDDAPDLVLMLRDDHIASIKDYVSNHASFSLDSIIYDEKNMLHYACIYGHIDIVQYLVSETTGSDADVNVVAGDGKTALHFACWKGHFKIVQYLLKCQGINVDAKDTNGWTAIYYATRFGYLDILQYLLQNTTISRPKVAPDGTTLLHVASTHGRLDIVNYLLFEKISLETEQTNEGVNAFHLASMHGHLDIIKYFVSRNSSAIHHLNANRSGAFHYACFGGYIEVVQYTKDNLGISVTSSNGRNMDGLDVAIMNDCLEVIKFLFSSIFFSPVILHANSQHLSPLHLACIHGKLQVVRLIVKDRSVGMSKAEQSGHNRRLLAMVEQSGLNALLLASRNGHVDVVQFLLEEGNAVTDCVTTFGLNALHLASCYGHLNVVQYLVLQNHFNVHVASPVTLYVGFTALHFAVRNGYIEIVRCLVMHGQANLEQPTSSGITALQIAKKDNNLAMIELLLELGAKVDNPEVDMDDHVWWGISNAGKSVTNGAIVCKTKIERNLRDECTTVCGCCNDFL